MSETPTDNILYKDKFQESANVENGSWAFLNHHDHTSISKDFYALVVPNKIHAKLGDFSAKEEKEFWQLTFDISKIALRELNAAAKGTHGVMIGVNDGVYAGQTVPHTHSHIVGIHEEKKSYIGSFNGAACDLEEEMNAVREQYCPELAPPLARAVVTCNLKDINKFTANIRKVRERLPSETASFRIYTKTPLYSETQEVPVIVESCTKEKPQFSVAKGLRLINGLMSPEGIQGHFGLIRFTHFSPH